MGQMRIRNCPLKKSSKMVQTRWCWRIRKMFTMTQSCSSSKN